MSYILFAPCTNALYKQEFFCFYFFFAVSYPQTTLPPGLLSTEARRDGYFGHGSESSRSNYGQDKSKLYTHTYVYQTLNYRYTKAIATIMRSWNPIRMESNTYPILQ